MLTMAKTFEQLVTPTSNGIAVSVRYVSSTPVILDAGLNDRLRRRKKNLKTVTPFPKWNINIKISLD